MELANLDVGTKVVPSFTVVERDYGRLGVVGVLSAGAGGDHRVGQLVKRAVQVIRVGWMEDSSIGSRVNQKMYISDHP